MAAIMKDRITEFSVRFICKEIDERHDRLGSDWGHGATHWEIWVIVGRRRFLTYYSQGPAHKGEPNMAWVMECLVGDASAYDGCARFEDFCKEFGYDPDSRSAERVYAGCTRASKQLRRLLGEEAYEKLLYETERE